MTHFNGTGAAITHQAHGDPFPKMIWPTNTYKLACATMFTLFFAGNDFAPLIKIDDQPIQEYLQRHYCAAMQQVALRLRDLPNVVGFETMNEPSSGYIGVQDVGAPFGRLKLGECPTPFQSMLLGSGIPQQVEIWKVGSLSLKKTGSRWVNTAGESAWLPIDSARSCIWKQHGVWDVDHAGKPAFLRPEYFARVGERRVDFNQDYLRPFCNRFARAIREVIPEALIFVEHDPSHPLRSWVRNEATPTGENNRPQVPPRTRQPKDGGTPGFVFAPHWYDALTLLKKQFNAWVAVDEHSGSLVFGKGRIRKAFAAQLASLKTAAAEDFGGPMLLGEFGIAFDLDGKKAFRSGDFSAQERALERSFRAVEDNLLSCTLWNYTPDNSNARGDLWNDEDFSIFCKDQQDNPGDLNSGGRALQVVVRPYARVTAGEPLDMSFDSQRKVFRLTFRHDSAVTEPSEIFVPNLQYPAGCRVEVSDGSWEHQAERRVLIYVHSDGLTVHTVTISPPG
jgi:hypothetical protein